LLVYFYNNKADTKEKVEIERKTLKFTGKEILLPLILVLNVSLIVSINVWIICLFTCKSSRHFCRLVQ